MESQQIPQNRKSKEYQKNKLLKINSAKQDPNIIFEDPRKDLKFPETDFLDFSVFSEKLQKNIKLKTYRYLPPENHLTKAILFLFHGLNSSVAHGSHIAKAFSEKGFIVVGFDHRGFGQSEGKSGYLESLETHLADSKLFVKKIMDQYGKDQYKYFLAGLSMGGMTSYRLSLENPELFAGAILMAPAIQHNQSKLILGFVNLMVYILPDWHIFGHKNEGTCHKSPLMTKIMRNDSNTYKGNMCLKTIQVIYEAINSSNKTFENYKCPFIVVQGGLDKLIDPDVGFDLVERSQSEDKQVLFYDNMWHDCWHEEELQDFLPKVINWACQRI
ncbi:hypothetical protein IMG5_169260 [Ichthyophthirius multifiliis]|uniref:Serine aminopeptidase S33 domain-containing protein n=1 Tax=Ichthyophthirius multifiliis TaxID=5932 RepID=G0R196_ICHMU|nr:hypothetical protein IMG5_169260 [Ichthyophthirius multifiliis]EGR28729.1 hypothetical protein IMG5_169260 [Ichthyophthirius multifiliis]|eukprot:XP_004029965.1 hypothetical protein IMG5_169260 [Ichthyophthirius multifiliis]